jgi:DNA-directed RNA polymerase subunit RPC12/RpoP
MFKYHCTTCDKEFNEPDRVKDIRSSFVKEMIIHCPYCNGYSIELTKRAELLLERKTKINKIESDNTETKGIT